MKYLQQQQAKQGTFVETKCLNPAYKQKYWYQDIFLHSVYQVLCEESKNSEAGQ